jgi:hypothetical protein
MKRFAAVQGTCFLLRSITIMATILPNPYDTCINTSRDDEIPLIEAFKVMLGMRFTCGDVLYSGHAANFTLMALIWQEYGKSYFEDPNRLTRESIPLRYVDASLVDIVDDSSPVYNTYSKEWYVSKFFPRLCWAIAVIGYLIIIACRFHYTVDVVVGIVVVAKQWGLYHMVIRTPKLLERVPFLQWYESKGVYAPRSVTKFTDNASEMDWDARSVVSEMGFEESPRMSPQPDRRLSAPPVVFGSPIMAHSPTDKLTEP